MTRSLVIALSVATAACGVEDPVVDEVAPLEGEPEPVAMPDGKSDAASSPQLWRYFWYYTYYGRLSAPLEQVAPSPPAPGTRTVLLVPGTTIGPEFFVPMAKRLRRDGFDPVIWAPPDLFTESLATGAGRIADKVERVLAERGAEKLHIIAECDGGVAARYFAQRLGGAGQLDQLITFVSAHHGSEVAPVGAWVTGWQALRDIQPSSAFLASLDATPLPPALRMTSIYTCRDEYLWPYTTSRVTGANNVEVCGRVAGHFDGFWDPVIYAHILGTLRGQAASLPTSY